MPMKAKHSKKRLLAGLLALVMAFGLAAGAIPGLGGGIFETVEAANGAPDTYMEFLGHEKGKSDDYTNNTTEGRIVIQMLDSSVPGADAATKGFDGSYKLNTAFAAAGWNVWPDGLSVQDVIVMPEGLARMDGRKLVAYDITAMITVDAANRFKWSDAAIQAAGFVDTDNKPVADAQTKMNDAYAIISGDYGNVPYIKIAGCLRDPKFSGLVSRHEVNYSTRHTADGASYMYITKANNNGGANTWLVDDHQYIFVESPDLTESYYGYVPNSGGENPTATENKAWQLYVNWVDKDDSTTKPDIHLLYDGTLKNGSAWIVDDHGDGSVDDAAGDDTQPLHNEVMRGGFSFRVANMETGDFTSPSAGSMQDSVFAVFNVSYTAQPGYATEWDTSTGLPVPISGELADLEKGYGYVTVGADNNNEIGAFNANGTVDNSLESVACFPAYRVDEVISAWKEYLTAGLGKSNGATWASPIVGGAYGLKLDAEHDYRAYDIGANKGLFQMGTVLRGGKDYPLIPCLVLKPDANGLVKTPSAYSLPVGNYLILQVKAGDGMYVDENFQPVVSIGPWGSAMGYGNYAPGVMGTGLDTSLAMSKNAGLALNDRYRPVAYVQCNTGAMADITNIGNGNCFFVTSGGVRNSYTAVANEPNARYKAVSSLMQAGGWTVNMNNGTYTSKTSLSEGVGNRRIPHEGYSRFMAYQVPVRAGIRFYIGDADDVSHAAADTAGDYSRYIAESQGDGELSGAKFRIYNSVPESVIRAIFPAGSTSPISPKVTAGIDEVPRVENMKKSQKQTLTFGARDYQEYTVYKEAGTGKYFLEIPTDELPFGVYAIKEALTGPGYGSWEGNADPDWSAMTAEDFTPTKLIVRNENGISVMYDSSEIGRGDAIDNAPTKDATDAALNKYVIGGTSGGTSGTLYVPQTIVRGGYAIDASGDDSFDGSNVKVTVKVFNISDHYVYVDKDNDGETEKYPTSKSAYNQNVRGKALTVQEINNITSAWPSCVVELRDMSLGDIRHDIGLLPYGTYLIAVTEVTEGYTPVTSVFVTDRIDYKDDEIQYSVKILDQSRIPLMTTTLLDNAYQLDSVPWKSGETLVDTIDMSNLQDGIEYTLYGMLLDTTSGTMIPGTRVSTVEHISGYKAPVNTDGTENVDNGAIQANLRDLLTKGETFSAGIHDLESYGVWLYNMQDFAAASRDSILPGLVNSSIANFQSAGNNVTTYLQRYHTPLVARLRYLAGDTAYGGTGADLTGKQSVKLYYNNLAARNDAKKENDLEGRTMVSVVILCEGPLQPDAMTATDLGSLMAITNSYSVAIRNDLHDEEETVRVAAIDVTAEASYTGGKTIDPSETVKATVTYGNMELGLDYKLTVKLRDADGQWVTDVGGNEMEVTTGTFRATQVADTYEALFEGLDVAKYNNQRLTAFARLDRVTSTGNSENSWWLIEKGDAATMGYNAGDPEPGRNQVDVVAPTVRTVLSDKYGAKTVDFDNKVTLVDKIDYTRLVAGGRYESVMTLVDTTGVTLKDDAGKDLIFVQQFTVPETNTDGKFSIEIEAAFDGKGLLGQNIVSYNDLYHITPDRKAHVAMEHELSSADQTIEATGESVRIFFSTVARDDNSHTHYVSAGADTSVTDVVTIRNVVPGEKYVLKTELAQPNNGKVLAQVEPIYTQVTADNDGDIRAEVKINLNTNAFKGQALVVYQTLYDAKEKEIIAQHTSNTDTNQMLYIADVDTVATGENGRSKRIHPNLVEDEEVSSATVNGEHVVTVTKSYAYETTIMDRVYYSNLVPGNEYRITTEVVTKKGGKEVGSTSQNYMPTEATGAFTAFIDVDVTDFLGEDLVIYETVTDVYNNQVVAVHKDLDDKDQTVRIMASAEQDPEEDPNDPGEDPNDPNNPNNPNNPGEGPNTGKNIQTGVAEHYPLFFALAALLLAGAGIGGFWYFKKRK